MADMAGQGCKWQYMAVNGWICLEMADNCWKLQEMAGYRLKCWKLLEMTEHDWNV